MGRVSGVDIDRLPIAAVLVDAEFRIAGWNAACEQLFGYTESEVLGSRMSERLTASLPEGTPTEDVGRLREMLLQGLDIRHTARFAIKEGRVRWCEFVGRPVRRAGSFSGAMALFVDVTERVTSVERLAASEKRLRAIVLETPMIAGIANRTGHIVLANPRLAALAGVDDPDRLEGRLWDDVFGSFPEDEYYWSEFQAGRLIDSYEGRMQTTDGVLTVVWGNVLLHAEDGPLSASIGLDVTEERSAQEALVVAQQRLRQLTREVLEVERLERQRIAEGLHDDIIQVLAASLIQIDRLTARLTDSSITDVVQSVRSMLVRAADRTRLMMFELQPASLYSGGLEDAIRETCNVAAAEAGFEVLIDVASGRFDGDVEELAYRTVREAVVNAAKHSAARRVCVTIVEEPTVLRGAVTDDGRGFDPSKGRDRDLGRVHLGMSSMSRRLQVVGGEFHLTTAPGTGTRIDFSIPKTGLSAPPAS